MRVLFSSTPGDGHIYPLLPLAQALKARDHDVAFATSTEHSRVIEGGGFTYFPCGVTGDELNRRVRPYLTDLPPLTSPMYFPFVIEHRYALADTSDRLSELRTLSAEWRPDLIVFESCDLAAPIAAAALGAPAVHHSFGRALAAACYQQSERHVEPLWASTSTSMPPLCGMYEGLYVDICPPSLQGQEVPAGTRISPSTPASPARSVAPLPWLDGLPKRPSVYVTLGTVFNELTRLRLLLDGFADIDCNIVMTIGRDKNPGDLGALPRNATVERFIPQAALLPRMHAVVSHAGSGSMLAALAAGLPLLLLPRAADQYENARACAARGLGIVLMPDELDVESARQGLTTILSEPSYTDCAKALRDEITAMPSADDVAEAICATL